MYFLTRVIALEAEVERAAGFLKDLGSLATRFYQKRRSLNAGINYNFPKVKVFLGAESSKKLHNSAE